MQQLHHFIFVDLLQETLGAKPVSLHKACATRWLSYDKAVDNTRKVYTKLMLSLEREVKEKNCPKAAGFVKYHLSDPEFLLSLETLHRVLPTLASLSKKFQVIFVLLM